jgi:hypothetical protein
MHEYTGAKDGMQYSKEELDPKVIKKRIRSLMKSPRKKPLKLAWLCLRMAAALRFVAFPPQYT